MVAFNFNFKYDSIVAEFEKHCVGEANITYERYVFHQRVQQSGEKFDEFLADLRKKAATCEFAALEDSLIRDRIVIGIRDDPTRRRLLQVKKLELTTAIDACKASEATSRRLRAMGGSGNGDVGEIDALHNAMRSSRDRRSSSKPRRFDIRKRDQSATRDKGNALRCYRCGATGCGGKADYRAQGKTCDACHKQNHFAAMC
jgi:hypothetical protein